jgi:hypothetical protein
LKRKKEGDGGKRRMQRGRKGEEEENESVWLREKEGERAEPPIRGSASMCGRDLAKDGKWSREG